MLSLFVPTAPFQDWGGPSSGSGPMGRLSQVFAGLIVIVSLAALTLTLARAIVMLSFGDVSALPQDLEQLPPNA